jgi:hypothetical protein
MLLSKTNFVNDIDAASLSLIMPIIEKGLRSKYIEVKIAACKAIEVVAGVTEADDLLLYFDRLLPSFGASLFDSIPEVRNTAAVSIGKVASCIGETNAHEIV